MDTFRSNFATLIDTNLAVQKELFAFNESQIKLSTSHLTSGFEAYRNGLAATHNAFAAMTKVYVDALRPAAS